MSKLIVGLVGHISAGKETSFSRIRQRAEEDGIFIAHHRFGDILRETLANWNQPTDRSHCDRLVPFMQEAFGLDALPKAMKGRLAKSSAVVDFLDGIRLWPDVEFLKSFSGSVLLYITAPAERRSEWARERAKKPGAEKPKEAYMSDKEFQLQEQQSQERFITEIGETADVKVYNDGTLEDLYATIDNFYDKYIAKK